MPATSIKLLHLLEVPTPFSWEACWLFLSCSSLGMVLFLWGAVSYSTRKSYEKKLTAVGLKNAMGQVPKISSVQNLGNGREKIILDSFGVGIDSYKNKKSNIEAAFGGVMESIICGNSPRFVEIISATRPLPSKIMFSEIEESSRSVGVLLSWVNPIQGL